MSLPKPLLRVAALWTTLALLLSLSACHRTFLYPASQPPTIQEGYVTVEAPNQEARRYPIEKVEVLRSTKAPGEPTAQELEALRSGAHYPGLDTLVLQVDAGVDIWEDYAVPGFWTGALIGGALGALLGWSLTETYGGTPPPASRRAATSALLGLGIGMGLGVEFMGFGALLGLIFNPKTTDMRGL